MDESLHKVMDNELQTVHKWLESHLPESWGMYGLTRNVLCGQWTGQSFYTLGWPDIRGVVTGEQEDDHPCPEFYDALNSVQLYAPKDEDVETLLDLKQVETWTKPQFKSVMPQRIIDVMERMARQRGHDQWHQTFPVTVYRVTPEDNIAPMSAPRGYKIGPVCNETHINFCLSTRQYNTPHFDKYLRAVSSRLPSACVTDDQGQCVCIELGFDDGSAGFLYTHDMARRKGLAKVVMSHMAEQYRRLNHDYFSCVIIGNDRSFVLHDSMGFKPVEGRFAYVGILM